MMHATEALATQAADVGINFITLFDTPSSIECVDKDDLVAEEGPIDRFLFQWLAEQVLKIWIEIFFQASLV